MLTELRNEAPDSRVPLDRLVEDFDRKHAAEALPVCVNLGRDVLEPLVGPLVVVRGVKSRGIRVLPRKWVVSRLRTRRAGECQSAKGLPTHG